MLDWKIETEFIFTRLLHLKKRKMLSILVDKMLFCSDPYQKLDNTKVAFVLEALPIM